MRDGVTLLRRLLLAGRKPAISPEYIEGGIKWPPFCWWHFYMHFLKKHLYTLIHISQKFVARGLIDNKSSLVQVIAWHRMGNKPFPEPMMTKWCYFMPQGHTKISNPDSKLHRANMGPIWGWQDPGGPHIGPMNFAIWEKSNHIIWGPFY